jgi:hypothetical protein
MLYNVIKKVKNAIFTNSVFGEKRFIDHISFAKYVHYVKSNNMSIIIHKEPTILYTNITSIRYIYIYIYIYMYICKIKMFVQSKSNI